MQRRGAVGFGCVDVRFLLDQRPHSVFIAVLRRVDHRRASVFSSEKRASNNGDENQS